MFFNWNCSFLTQLSGYRKFSKAVLIKIVNFLQLGGIENSRKKF